MTTASSKKPHLQNRRFGWKQSTIKSGPIRSSYHFYLDFTSYAVYNPFIQVQTRVDMRTIRGFGQLGWTSYGPHCLCATCTQDTPNNYTIKIYHKQWWKLNFQKPFPNLIWKLFIFTWNPNPRCLLIQRSISGPKYNHKLDKSASAHQSNH